MYIKRDIEDILQTLMKQFCAVALFGPRQSGKTTLAKTLFPHYKYFSFEDFDNRAAVKIDPRAFLNAYNNEPGLIFDEVQHVPELLSYMQSHIDTHKKKGQFIITGSQNLLVNESVTQTLAGRIAILTLLPLSIHELRQANILSPNIDTTLLKGMYPLVNSDDISTSNWYKSYIATYVERDVRQIQNVVDLSLFQKCMQLCAGRIGQVLNVSALSADLGISVHATNQWLSILEACYIIFRLQPYYNNFSKRLIKAPKLYFYDTGLATTLLGISTTEQLFTHYLRGNLFESMIISDLKKQYYNSGDIPRCYFWRDHGNYEIDCIIETHTKPIALEIKASSTFNSHFLDNLQRWNTIAGTAAHKNIMLYGGELEMESAAGKLVYWYNSGDLLKRI